MIRRKIGVFGCLIVSFTGFFLSAMEQLNISNAEGHRNYFISELQEKTRKEALFNDGISEFAKINIGALLNVSLLSSDSRLEVVNGLLDSFETILWNHEKEVVECHAFLNCHVEKCRLFKNELSQDSKNLSVENRKLLVRTYKITVMIFDVLKLVYFSRLSLIRKQIEMTDELFKKSTCSKQARKSLLTQKEELLKTLILLEGKEKEILLKKNKAMMALEDYQPDWIEISKQHDTTKEEYLDKDTHELACSIQ